MATVYRFAIFFALLLASAAPSAADAPVCLGLGAGKPICPEKTTEAACLDTPDIVTKNVTGSCVWHQLLPDRVVETQRVTTRGGPIAVTGLDYRGSTCGLRLSVNLPPEARGKWGLNFRLMGGPSNVTDFSTILSPRVTMTSSGCTVGKGSPSKCTAALVAPEGYAQTDAFRQNTAIMDFFTSDLVRINEWRKKGRLSAANAFTFKTTAEFLRCGLAGAAYPTSPGEITDRVWFGKTAYNLFDNDQRGHYLLTYRAYRLANVSGAFWDVKVGKSLSASKTDLAVMLLRESDYLAWQDDCTTRTCAPPYTLALPETICQGLRCNGTISTLGGMTGAYRLVVSYPEVCGYDAPECYTLDAPDTIVTPFAKELVNVVIQAKNWVLAPLEDKEAKSADMMVGANSVIEQLPEEAFMAVAGLASARGSA